MHWKEYTHVLFRTSKLPNPRSQRDVMPSGRRREHAQYVTSLKIYFRLLNAKNTQLMTVSIGSYGAHERTDQNARTILPSDKV